MTGLEFTLIFEGIIKPVYVAIIYLYFVVYQYFFHKKCFTLLNIFSKSTTVSVVQSNLILSSRLGQASQTQLNSLVQLPMSLMLVYVYLFCSSMTTSLCVIVQLPRNSYSLNHLRPSCRSGGTPLIIASKQSMAFLVSSLCLRDSQSSLNVGINSDTKQCGVCLCMPKLF